jgi:hypothetical protein
MKSKLLLGAMLLSTLFAVTSCDKLANDLKLDLNQTVKDIDFEFPIITQSMVNKDTTLVNIPFRANIDSVLTANDIDQSKIESIYLKNCKVDIIEGQSAATDFSFIDSLYFEFKEASQASFKKVGSVSNSSLIGKTSFTVLFPNPETAPDAAIDLADYFGKSNFIYSVSGKAKKATDSPIKARATLSYTVSYKAAGE